jgi:hypothetical protein
MSDFRIHTIIGLVTILVASLLVVTLARADDMKRQKLCADCLEAEPTTMHGIKACEKWRCAGFYVPPYERTEEACEKRWRCGGYCQHGPKVSGAGYWFCEVPKPRSRREKVR